MRKLLALAAASVAAAGAFAAPASAANCGALVVDVAGAAYVVVGEGTDNNGNWLYLESNGIPNLQRGGVALYGADLGGADPCVEGTSWDTIVF